MPDWSFGLFKQHYHRTKVGSLRAIAQVVNESAGCNFAQLVCDESGATIVPTYDWTDFFAAHLKKITSIKKYHHFRCNTSQPSVVFIKKHADTDEEKIDPDKMRKEIKKCTVVAILHSLCVTRVVPR